MNSKQSNTLFPFLIVFYEISIYLSMDAYLPALPKIAHQFAVGVHTVQFTITAWLLGAFVVQLILGPLSDRYGRRPVLLLGGVLYVLSTIACAAAYNIHILLVARFFQGMAMPSMYIAGYAAINEYFSSEKAIKILARLTSVTLLAPAFGPLLGGAMLLVLNWHWIFILLVIWSGVAVILLFYKMPETLLAENKLTRLHPRPIARQYNVVLMNPKFMTYALITFLPVIGLIAWMLSSPFIIIYHFHYSTFDFGIIQAFIFGSLLLGNRVVDMYSNEKRHHFLINLGLGCAVSGAILAVIATWLLPNALFVMIFLVMVLSFGAGLSIPILSRLTLDTSDAPMGIKVAVFSVVRVGSGFIGSLCMAYVYNGSMLSIALVMSAFAVMAVVIRIRMVCHHKYQT